MTQILSTLTLLSNIALILGVMLWITFIALRKGKIFLAHPLVKFFSGNARILAFTIALTATLGSLYYSEIAHLEPCKLCWFQRILMYPQAILLGLAILKNDRTHITSYALTLSGIGAVIAIYHYYLQRGGSEIIPCSTVGYSVSCAKVFVMSYGYITIPFMSLSAFFLILALMVLYKTSQSHK